MGLFRRKIDNDLDFENVDILQVIQASRMQSQQDRDALASHTPKEWLASRPVYEELTGPQKAEAVRLLEGVETQLTAIEEGKETLSDIDPEARRTFVALEERDAEDWNANAEIACRLGIAIGALIRKLEGTRALPPPAAFTEAVGPSDKATDFAPKIRALAEWLREGDEDFLPLVFAPGPGVWKSVTAWTDEYVRLTTMSGGAVAVMMDVRLNAPRFGYMLACYHETHN